MTFEQWENEVPTSIQADPLWKVEAYRLSLFLSDLAWLDVTKLAADPRTLGICDQLYRAVGKISSNISEGYSRGTCEARGLYYAYAAGATREARDWYFKGRHISGFAVSNHRIELCTSIIRLTLTPIRRERQASRRISAKEPRDS